MSTSAETASAARPGLNPNQLARQSDQGGDNKSTGPRTEQGKAISRYNARRHGLTGQTIIMTAEELAIYTKLCENLQSDLEPEGEFEIRTVQSIADAQWQLDRAHAIENNLFFELTTRQLPEQEPDSDEEANLDWGQGQARAFLKHAKEFDLLSRYATRFHRQIVQLKMTLDKAQKTRRKLEAAEELQAMRGGPTRRRPTSTNNNPQEREFVSHDNMHDPLKAMMSSIGKRQPAAAPQPKSKKEDAA